MDWNLAGAVILSGLSIVFLALILLILVVLLVGGLLRRRPGDAVAEPRPIQAATGAPPLSPAKTSSVTAAVFPGVSPDIVAIITAAVAASEEASGTPYAVTGITRGTSARPAWGFAGMMGNARPF